MNKMNRYILTLFTTIVLVSTSFGQDSFLPSYNPPSPEAASLGRYAEHEVGYFTGTPSISIPLYEINTGRIKVPITLSYHAGGIKVADIPSRVGMGWTLNAGGAVTKTVKGHRDDVDYNDNGTRYYGFFNLPSYYSTGCR